MNCAATFQGVVPATFNMGGAGVVNYGSAPERLA
jgi:hypothetical protein